MICYWCYWGWPKPIHNIYTRAVEKLGGSERALEFGPAHVVWADENWGSAQWCLDHFEDWEKDDNDGRFDERELEVVKQSLVELLSVQDEYKHPPEGFDDESPEKFPPPAHWEMKR